MPLVIGFALVLLFVDAGASDAGCSLVVAVDQHWSRPAQDSNLSPTFSWQLSSECWDEQQSYQIQVTYASNESVAWDSGRVSSNLSSNVPCPDRLSEGTQFAAHVTVFSRQGSSASGASTFITLLSPGTLKQAQPFWVSNASARFALFRKVLHASQAPLFLTISARPTANQQMRHGVNTSSLLGGYKLWVDGLPLGAGPGRRIGGDVNADTFNLTRLVQAAGKSGSVVAVESYYGPVSSDTGGLLAILHDGNGGMESGPSGWQAMDATAAFSPTFGLTRGPGKGEGEGSPYYSMPLERLRGDLYPHGWRIGADKDTGWEPAVAAPRWPGGVIAKQAMPVAMHDVAAISFINLTASGGGAPGPPYSYRIDFGHNFQGGLNVTFSAAAIRKARELGGGELLTVTVSVGEQMNFECSGPGNCTNLGLLPLTADGNRWSVNWTVGGGNPTVDQSFVPHEYLEFRYADIVGAPEPPSFERVRGWAVHYPFQGDLNDNDALAQGDASRTREIASAAPLQWATQVSTSNPGLNKVWDLAKWTITAATLDANTDSNTRQRDVCTLDAYLQTVYQGGVYPATSYHHRRRVAQFMFEPLGYVNYWSEFLTSAMGALSAFTFDFDDDSLARSVWNSTTPATKPGCGPYSVENYTLSAYFDESQGLVLRTPKPLVDWPRSEAIDINEETAAVCNDACVQMNAHAVTAQLQASFVTGRMGMESEAAEYKARALAIRKAAHGAFFQPNSSECTPPGVGQCYRDMVAGKQNYTTAQATGMATDAKIGGNSTATLELVPFLRARNQRRGIEHGLELSGWQAFFMLRGVYSAASETEEGDIAFHLAADAASFGWDVLTGTGMNSWLGGMINMQNATMTTESWIVSHAPLPGEGGSTMSHPWTAAPAAIIPRWLMGVRPLSPGWRTVAVRPMPPEELEQGNVTVPSPRGPIVVAFRQHSTASAWTWSANVTVPGNTLAQVCAPRYNAGEKLTCGSTPATVRRGALLCLEGMVLGGTVDLRVSCST